MKPFEYPIYFKINNKYYHVITIRNQPSKGELFVHFPWGSREPSEYQIIGSKEIDNWHLPDHISYHVDRSTHVKARDGNKKFIYLDRLEATMNVLNLTKGGFMGIYLESIFTFDLLLNNKRLIEKPTPKNAIVWNMEGHDKCSLLLISKCGSIHPQRLLRHDALKNVTLIDQPLLIRGFISNEEKEKLPGGNKSGYDTEMIFLVAEETLTQQRAIFDDIQGFGTNIVTYMVLPDIGQLPKIISS